MATLIGVVRQAVGEVYAVAGDGSRRPLAEGDRVFAGEQLVTGTGGAVAVALANGGELTLGRDSNLTLDTQLLSNAQDGGFIAPAETPPPSTAPSAQDLTDVEQLQAAIAAGADPTVEGEATAAGPGAGGAAGGAGGGGGHGFVLLSEVGGALDPTIGFPTEGLSAGPEFPDAEPIINPDSVSVVDGIPSAGEASAEVDEEGLPGGIAGGVDDLSGELSSVSGSLGYSFGPDGAGSFAWSTAGLPDATSGGVPLTYSVSSDGLTLTAQAGSVTVFTLTVTDLAAGTYEFNLLAALDHRSPPSGTSVEDDLSFLFGYTITDGNGTTAAGSLAVTVDDDSPTIALADAGEGDTLEVDETTLSTDDSVDYAGAFDAAFGADGAGSLTYALAVTDGTDSGLVDTASGQSIFLFETATGVEGRVGGEGGDVAFSLTLNGSTVTLDQVRAVVHSDTGDVNELMTLGSGLVNLVATITDGDGDSASSSLDLGGSISFRDDGPALVEDGEGGPQVSGLVHEDPLTGPYAGNSEGGQTLTVSGSAGSLSALVDFGADGPGDFGLSSDLSSLDSQALTSEGTALSYSVVGDTLTASANGNTIFTLQVNADGSWTFTLSGPLDHPEADGDDSETLLGLGIDFSGVLTATDGDGDPLTGGFTPGSFVVDVEDDVPVIAEGGGDEPSPQVTDLVHEDPLTSPYVGNGEGSQTLVASGSAGSLHALVSFGADGPGDFGLSNNLSSLDSQALTSEGTALTYSVVGDTLTASANGNTIFTLQVNTDGSWTFTLSGPLDHPEADGNDGETLPGLGIDFSGVLTATDGDGDPVVGGFNPGSFVIDVEDDVPVLAEGGGDEPSPQVSGLVHEDPLTSPHQGNGEIGQTLTVSGAAGSLSALVSFGADGPGDFGLSADLGALEVQALTSEGTALSYSVVGDTLTASANGNTIFTLQVNADGSWIFTLSGPLDHPVTDGDDSETLPGLGIDFSGVLTATDGDGDPVIGGFNPGSFVIDVEDDVPVLAEGQGDEPSPQVSGLVNEDPLTSPYVGNGEGSQTLVASGSAGSLHALVSFGADGPGDFGLSSDLSSLDSQALTSEGTALTYSVVGDTLTASANGNTIFTLQIGADGSWTFTLSGPLDHPVTDGSDSETLPGLGIDFSGVLTATDGDGDPVGDGFNPGSFVIDVEDDVPVLAEGDDGNPNVSGLVHEDALTTGAPYEGNNEDSDGVGSDTDPAQTLTASGSASSLHALVSFGADGPGDFGLSDSAEAIESLTDQGWTSQGFDLEYSVDASTGLLTATADGNSVFTLQVNADGSWTFTLTGPLDHPEMDGNDSETLDGSGIDFSGILTATDGDGDPLLGGFEPGSFVIEVQDDVPVLAGSERQRPTVAGRVHEDALTTGAPYEGNNEDSDGVGSDTDPAQTLVAIGAAGALHALVSFGADGPGDFGLSGSDAAIESLTDQGWTSQGFDLDYSVDTSTGLLTATANGNAVFTLQVNSDGSYTFTLQGPLDHPEMDGNDSETLPGAGLDFSGILSATDGDGDPLLGGFEPGSFVIDVEDDVPVQLGDGVIDGETQVDEDSLVPDGIDDGPDGVDAVASGSLSGLVSFGADGPGEFSLLGDTSGLPALESNGVAVEYVVVGDTLTATAGGNPVFTFSLDSDGNYIFTLQGQLDHPLGNGDDLELMPVDLSSIIQATDGDGDPVVLDGSFVINVEDDVPVAHDNEACTEESGLPPFNLTLVIDSSGSMADAVMADLDGDGVDESTTRFEVAQAAMINLINSYIALGVPLNFKVIDFDSDAELVYEGTDAAAAQAAISAMTAGGLTNYEDALEIARDELEDDLVDPALDGYVDRVYFLSDGQPFPSEDDAPADWQDFVDDNNIDVIAVGIQIPSGGNAESELGEVANSGDTVIVVQDPNDLAAALEDTVPNPLEGNVITDTGPGGVGDVDASGADAPIRVTQISFVNAAGATITVLVPAGGSSGPITTPLGGTLVMSSDGSYSYAAPDNVTEHSEEVFTYTVVDADGDPSSATLTICVEDGVPLAVDDTASMTEDTDTVGGNVISNDDVGTDAPGSVNFTSTTGTYGNLTFNVSGGWTYDLQNANPVVQGLGVGESLTETFNYILTDADGDTSPASLTITITGENDLVTINGLDVNGGEQTVDEDDLVPDGSDPTKESTTVSGTFSVSAPDGLEHLTVGGIVVMAGGVANGFPQSTTTPLGNTLTVTGFNPVTGVVSYSYTLLDNEAHTSGLGQNFLTEHFAVLATDDDGDSDSASLDINIRDDVPNALNDSNGTASETQLSLSGNVLTNDVQGADQVASGPITGGTFVGTYGTLVLNANGSYTYTLDATDPQFIALGGGGSATETFTYTHTDADGDSDTATLSLGIHNNDSDIELFGLNVQGGEQTVDEDDLVPDGSDLSDSTTVSGTFTVTAPDGVLNLSVGGIIVVLGGIQNSFPQSTVTPQGNLLSITGFNAATGEVDYSYTLLDNENHAPGAGENSLSESFAVLVSDIDGDSDFDFLDVNITDDVPDAVDNLLAGSVSENGTVAVGDVLGNDIQGADRIAVTGSGAGSTGPVTPLLSQVGTYGTLNLYADGTYSYTVDTTDADFIALGGGGSAVESFTYTLNDSDGDSDNAALSLTVVNDDDGVTVTGLDLNGGEQEVNEDDLANGSSPDVGALTQSGSFSISALDGVASISIGSGGPYSFAQLQNSGTTNLVIDSPAGVLTITGFTGTATGGTVSYEYTLENRIDHDLGNGENSATESFAVTVTDVDGDSDTDSLDITIIDDVPTAQDNEACTVESSLTPFNLTLILDSSGSMNDAVMADLDGDGVDEATTRLEVAKAAVINLINAYVALGVPLNLKIIDFDTDADLVYEGTDPGDAQAAVSAMTAGGVTNYEDALTLARSELEDDLIDPALAGYDNRLYFLSDGQPFPSEDDAPADWQDFVDDNGIDVIAVGIQIPSGGNAEDELGEVANSGDTVIVVQDPNELSAALENTVTDPLEGNVITDVDPVAGVDVAGADAPIAVTQVSYVNGSGDTVTVLVPAGGSTAPITTPLGGTLIMSSDGSYSYLPPVDVSDDTEEVFTYTVIDSDGDTSNAQLTLCIEDAAPVIGQVDEDELPNGNTDNDAITTVATGNLGELLIGTTTGQFSLSSNTSGLPPLESGGVNITYAVAGNVLTASAGLQTIFTLEVESNGDYTFTLLGPLDHPDADNDDNEKLAVNLSSILQASDGIDPMPLAGDFLIQVEDDIPVAFLPVTALLVDQTSTPHTITAGLNFANAAGGDGVGDAVFNITVGAIATDADGQPLKLDGEQLYLYYGTDQTQLVAKTADNDIGYTIDIDPAGDTYTLTTFGVISNGFDVSATNLTGVGAGNVAYKALLNIGGTTQDVLISTTTPSGSINSDLDDIGISNQWIDTGEKIRFDFINGLATGGANGTGFIYTDHNLANSFKQKVFVKGGGGNTAMLIVTAILADNDYVFGTSDAGESQVNLTTSNIKVFNSVGTDVTGSVTLTDIGNSIIIDGMKNGWSYQVSSATSFSAVHVQGGEAEDFSLGFFTYSQVVPGQPIDLAHPITATDGDGDSITSVINSTLYPLATSVEGTSADNVITGTAGVDQLFGNGGNDNLSGLLGNDVLSGGDGDDFLTGGLGNDLLSGGAGKDTLVWNSGDTGVDHVTDFFIDGPAVLGGNSDALDLAQLLTGEDDSGNVLDDYLSFTFAATSTTIDVRSTAGGSVVQQVVLDGVDLSSAAYYGSTDAATVIDGMLGDNALKVDTV